MSNAQGVLECGEYTRCHALQLMHKLSCIRMNAQHNSKMVMRSTHKEINDYDFEGFGRAQTLSKGKVNVVQERNSRGSLAMEMLKIRSWSTRSFKNR